MSKAQTSDIPDLLTLLPFSVLVLSRQHTITYANNAAEDTLGESATYLAKRKLPQIFHPSDKLLALIDTAFTHNTPLKEYDFPLSGPRMGARLVTLHIVPLAGGNEALLCFDDASNAVTLSQTARHNNQGQRHMAAILAHEVKNPLAGIRGAAQLLKKTVRADDVELTTLICNEADRIKSVVEEMEFFSNPAELATEMLNIHEVLHYARSVVETSSGGRVSFRERFDPSLPPVRANRNLLVQAFINLFKNASEASDKKIIISLTSSYRIGKKLKTPAPAARTPLPISITVEDDGPGIPPALQESIFEPFVTSKTSGKGLGLAIVAKIIADHGGVIELDTLAEKGARFNIFLPVA